MLQQITCMTIRFPSSPMTPERYISLPFSWGGLGGILIVPHHYMPDSSPWPLKDTYHYHLGCFFLGGYLQYPACSTSLQARFFPMTPEKYIISLGGLGVVSCLFSMSSLHYDDDDPSGSGPRWRLTIATMTMMTTIYNNDNDRNNASSSPFQELGVQWCV